MNKGKKIIGAAAGIAAIAAGTYFLYGKDGKKNREKVRGWALKAKGEILEGVEKLREVNKDAYHKVVERVQARYKKFQEVDRKELDRLASEAKGYWTGISGQIAQKLGRAPAAAEAAKPKRKHGRVRTKTA